MASHWYYAKGSTKHGPLSGRDLKQLADSGELHPDDLIWKTGMTDWQPANTVKGLLQNRKTSDPVPPPLVVRSESSAETESVSLPDLKAATKSFLFAAKELSVKSLDAVQQFVASIKSGTHSESEGLDQTESDKKPVPKWAILTTGRGC